MTIFQFIALRSYGTTQTPEFWREEAGKDTTSGGGKLHDTHIPQDAYVELLEISHKLGADKDKTLLGVGKSCVRHIVSELGDEMAS